MNHGQKDPGESSGQRKRKNELETNGKKEWKAEDAAFDIPAIGSTGSFGDQLVFYQRAGFRVTGIVRDFFLKHYTTQLWERGVQHRDMLRLSDARMSGTSYGACVLHVAPESFIGGPLALLRTGDIVSIDVEARSIRMEVSDEELERRRAAWTPPAPRYERGYGVMFSRHIQQADEGCDFDFLRGKRGAAVPRHSH